MVLTSMPMYVIAADPPNACIPSIYDPKVLSLASYNDIPLVNSKGKKLNQDYLLNKMGVGEAIVVYGCPKDVQGNEQKKGMYNSSLQWRYMGWDINGNVYYNWNFPRDSDVTKSVGKNWVKMPWDKPKGIEKKLTKSTASFNDNAPSWLEKMLDPYDRNKTFLQSYNRIKNTSWTGVTLLDYAIIQQAPSSFGPGIVQLWSEDSDGKWWYQMFDIPALKKIEPAPELPDLIITKVVNPTDAWAGDTVAFKVTVKNIGKGDAKNFNIGVMRAEYTVDPIRNNNLLAGQETTVTFNIKFNTKGLKNILFTADSSAAVVETDETNNTYEAPIMINSPNEPTAPIAIISHFEGDSRTEREIRITPLFEPQLSGHLSYSPGKEAITASEWKYSDPSGKTFNRQPYAKDFDELGEYEVQLRVTNSANKVSEWATLIILVTQEPVEEPEPEIPPVPDLKADIEFQPPVIITGETSTLWNFSQGLSGYEWTFTENLVRALPNTMDYEFPNIKYTEPGSYAATIKVFDEAGGWKTDTAILRVIDPKPIAIVSGITKVIQSRPLVYPHHLNNSYTPIADRGVTIDFSRSEKRYKKEFSPIYTDGWFNEVPSELGKYILEGKVYDSDGRVSDWASLVMEVVPDQPPVVALIAPEEAYRTSGFNLYIDAESPDGDIITYLKIEERYDADNDGDFEEEDWTTLYEGDFKALHALTYTTVGKRQYRATVREDYGLEAASDITTTDILNIAPTAGFDVYGIIEQPGQGEDSSPPLIEYDPATLLRTWTIVNPFIGGAGDKTGWKSTAAAVSTKNAVFANYDVKYPNSGNGANSRTKYQLADDLVGMPSWQQYGIIEKVFPGNRIYSQGGMTFESSGSMSSYQLHFNEHDSITGTVLSEFSIAPPAGWYPYFGTISSDEKIYILERRLDNVNFDRMVIGVYDKKGSKIDTIQFDRRPGTSVEGAYSLSFMDISPDGRYLYSAIKQAYNYVDDGWFGHWEDEVHLYKYDLQNKTLHWEAAGGRLSKGLTSFNHLTYSDNGDVYLTTQFKQSYSANMSYNGEVMRVTPSGVSSTVSLPGSSLSPPAISNDGKKLYVLHATAWEEAVGTRTEGRTQQYLSTYDITDTGLRSANTLMLMYAGSMFPYNYQDLNPTMSPIVHPDGRVFIQTRIFGTEKHGWMDYNGNLLQYSQLRDAPNTGKAFLNDKGQIVSVLFDHIYFEWVDGKVQYYTSAAVNNNTTGAVIAETSNRGSLPGSTSYARPLASVTPILPDGSIYAFGSNTVVPFVSASGQPKIKEVDANTVEIVNDNWGGLLYDASTKAKNYAIEFNVSVNDPANAKTVGAAIQIQDAKNMYALEWTKDKMTLYKVVNGVKTSLNSIQQTRTAFLGYTVKLESVNGVLRVFINHSKAMEIADSRFTSGYAGIMSHGQSNASFANVKMHNYGDTYMDQSYEAVLINDPVMYEKLFFDVENDPLGSEEWSYSHNPNFFENPLGLSLYHGLTQHATVNAFDKPGVYEITYRAKDRVNLESYEKWSEYVSKLLYVHRRPEALPDVRLTGKVYPDGEALDYETYDQSYDPDVPGVLSEKLFRTRWADETSWTMGKRQFYNRPGVDLIIQEQVRDIHGAWSYWGQTVVYKEALPAVNQNKPVMTITYPAGTTTAGPTVLVDEPLIRWTYYDRDNDPQELYRLILTYVDNGETAFFGEFAGKDTSYQIPLDWIEDGRVVSVQGQVFSAGIWSDMSNIRYFVLDLPPMTYLTSYNGAASTTPVYTNVNRPVLSVFTVDPENHPITAIDYEVVRVADLETVVDTNSLTPATSYTPPALAEGLHYWRARAFDSYIWGPYSSNGFFFVDTVKPLDVDEQLEIEPTAVTVRFNAFSDPAPSSGHASRVLYMQQVNADGSLTNIDLNRDGNTEYSIPLSLNTRTYKVTGLIPGNRYRLTVIDTDVAGNQGHYAYIYFYTNRPPTADFDWTPKPVYEGDTAAFTTKASDPDGDELEAVYEITSPSGKTSRFSYRLAAPYASTAPAIRMLEAGLWKVTLTVSDGIAEPVRVTKNVQVMPLTVGGAVKHTEQWDANRKAYNRKISGNDEQPRAYSVFWAGERFMLEGIVTATGTATRAERVEVAMGSRTVELSAVNDASALWTGSMWDESFMKLADGNYTFQFTAFYNNGIVKIADVSIEISGNALQLTGVHRVQ